MMSFLVHDIFDHDIPLAAGIREGTIAFLPLKFPVDKLLFIDPFTAIGFYNTHKIGNAVGDGQSK